MSNGKKWRTLACALIGIVVLAGCATPRDFYEQAVKTNVSIEEGHNRILFLNVIRSMKRQPMHFTGFAKISGPAGAGTPTLGFSLPFGPDFKTNIYTFSPSYKPDTPSYE